MGKESRKKRAARDRKELLDDVAADVPTNFDDLLPGPAPPESRTFQILYRYSKAAPLWLSTPVLLNLTRLAREQEMNRLLPEGIELDPSARHMVAWAARHWSEDLKHDNVRCQMFVGTREYAEGGPNGDPPTFMLDFPTRQFASLLDLHASGFSTARQRLQAKLTHAESRLMQLAHDLGYERMNFPAIRDWVGTRSFAKVTGELGVYWTLFAASEVYGDDPKAMLDGLLEHGWELELAQRAVATARGPRGVQSASALSLISQAHPIVCEPEWVQAMDDWASWPEAIEFARQVHLPFDCVYLDFTGPGGYCPRIALGTVVREEDGERRVTMPVGKLDDPNTFAIALRGAIMFRDGQGHLNVIVFGQDASMPSDEAYFADVDPLGFTDMDMLGRIALGPDPLEATLAEAPLIGHPDSRVHRTALLAVPYGIGPRLQSMLKLPARIELPFSMVQIKASGREDRFAHAWATEIAVGAFRALRALHMLQAGNVELVEAQVSRQVRRAGKREGLSMSLQVAVRLEKKLYLRPPGAEHGTVDWSHAWWVAGHPRYYPIGTMKADAQPPEKLVMHPVKGPCFMEWVAPYIKGNRDKGVVEKTRIVRDSKRKKAA